jgi:hypothetical protein
MNLIWYACVETISMRSWPSDAFPQCATSKLYNSACESDTWYEVQLGVTLHCYA